MAGQSLIIHPLLNILLVALAGGMMTFCVQMLLKHRDRAAVMWDALRKTLDDHEQRLQRLELKMGFFWNSVEEHMADILKRPTHLEMDALLEKLKEHTLTLDECYTLRRWLEEVYLGEQLSMPSQRVIAILVLGAVNSLILEYEKEQLLPATEVRIWSTPSRSWWRRLVTWWRNLWDIG